MFKSRLSLALALIPAAFAQTYPFSCNSTTAGTPALLRADGAAERVSDLLITCTGGPAHSPSFVSVLNVLLNGNVADSTLAGPGYSQALVLINDLAATPTAGVNVIQGYQSGNTVTFNVPVTPPGDNGTYTIRIVNLRVNAAVLSSGLGGVPAIATLTVSGGGALPITIPYATVGVTASSSTFTLENAVGSSMANLTFPAGAQNGGTITNRLQFTEGFAQSFRKRNVATTIAAPTSVGDQATPGTDYHTESGFYLSTLPATNGLNTAGLATQGTRLMASFTNVPSGVTLFVTTAPLPNTGATGGRLVQTDSTGGGAYVATASTATANFGGTAVGIAPVAISGGSGTATWEVLDADPAAVETFTFGLAMTYQSAPAGAASVTGGLAPFITGFPLNAGLPLPRFNGTFSNTGAASVPTLIAVPNALSLSYQTGTPAPLPMAIQLDTVPNEAMPFQVTVSAAQNGWISASGGASTPAQLTLTLTPANLSPGVYQAYIYISSPAQQFAPVSIPVILTVTTGPSGYIPLNCMAAAAISPLVRPEGMAESVGDVYLLCYNGIPTPYGARIPAYDIQLTLQTPITSRLYPSGWSEVLLLVDEPGSGAPGSPSIQSACGDPSGICTMISSGTTGAAYSGLPGSPNVFPGKVSGNTVTFFGIPIDPTGAINSLFAVQTPRVLRITNLRTDVTGVPPVTVPFGQPIGWSVSAGSLAISQPIYQYPVAVGYVWPSVTPSFLLPDGSANSPGAAIGQCIPAAPQRAGVLRLAAISSQAFKPRITSNPFPWNNPNAAPPLAPQNVPGQIYNTESGFYNPSLTSALVDFTTVGLADSGTRVRAQITNIPAGARVFVSTQNVVFNNGTPAFSPSSAAMLRLIQSETQTFAPVAASVTLDGLAAAELPVTNGTASAVWDTLSYRPNTQTNVDFIVWVQAGSTVSTSPATVTTSFAPAPPDFAGAAGHIASTTLPEPRFSASTTTLQLFSVISGCPGASLAAQGTPQSATVATAFVTPLQVHVKDGNGNPQSGITVTFSAPASGASAVLSGATAVTNASGVASVTATANTIAGSYTVTAATGSRTGIFSLTNIAGDAVSIAATSGTPQYATVNTMFPAPLQATVRDAYGNPVSGAYVFFEPPTSGASASVFEYGFTPGIATGNDGVASAYATANQVIGSYSVTAFAGSISDTFSLANTIGTTSVTVQTSPAGLAFSMDGGTFTAPHVFNFAAGSSHSLSVAQTIAGAAGMRYAFASWSNGGAASQTITITADAATYTAAFTTQYQLTTAASPAWGGTVSPASGTFYNAGTQVNVSASANGGFGFTGWTGPVSVAYSGSTTVTMNGPVSITAGFLGSGVNPQLDPASLTLYYNQSQNPPTTPASLLVNSDQRVAFTVTSPVSWLLVSGGSGAGLGTVMVTAYPNGIAPGYYTTMLNVAYAGGPVVQVPVQLWYTGLPQLRPAATTVSFIAAVGSTTAQTQTVSVPATVGLLPVQVTASGGSWLSVSPAKGATPVNVQITADPTGLAPGTYSGSVTITANASNSPLTIAVGLTVGGQ